MKISEYCTILKEIEFSEGDIEIGIEREFAIFPVNGSRPEVIYAQLSEADSGALFYVPGSGEKICVV